MTFVLIIQWKEYIATDFLNVSKNVVSKGFCILHDYSYAKRPWTKDLQGTHFLSPVTLAGEWGTIEMLSVRPSDFPSQILLHL